jgi:hypothetical protein
MSQTYREQRNSGSFAKVRVYVFPYRCTSVIQSHTPIFLRRGEVTHYQCREVFSQRLRDGRI